MEDQFQFGLLQILLIAWAAITLVLILVWVRRGVLSMKEEDQLFLDKAEDHIRKEQEVIIAKLNKLDKVLYRLGWVSGLLLLVIASVWVYQGLMSN